MTVQRYVLFAGAIGPTVSGGDWVKHEDYIALEAEVRALREDLQATKLLAHANAEMFKAERADMESLKRQCQILSFELLGVVIDTEQGHGFDPVCLDTIKRVRDQLHGIAGTKPCG